MRHFGTCDGPCCRTLPVLVPAPVPLVFPSVGRTRHAVTARTTLTVPERTPAMTTTTIEYGFKYGTDPVVWPDEDGDLGRPTLASSTDFPAYLFARGETALPRLQSAARAHNAKTPARRVVIHARTIATTETGPVGERLPTAPGSVIRATAEGVRGVFVLTADTDGTPWFRVAMATAAWRWVRPAQLSDVEVLFDAAEIAPS